MKKNKYLFLGFLFSAGILSAQQGRVGINTTTPNSTLDINSSGNISAEGVLVPRVSASDMKTMTAALTANQNALLTYLSETMPVEDRTGRLAYVSESGHYYYNATEGVWRRLYPTGFEKVTENSKSGWRLIGSNANNYGDIGSYAVDASYSNSASTTRGATGNYAFTSGLNTTASGNNSVAMGYLASAGNTTAIALGSQVSASGEKAVAIGDLSTSSGLYSVAMGRQAQVTSTGGMALGTQAKVEGTHAVAMGYQASSTANYSTAIGNNASATAANGVALGYYSKAQNSYAIAIGANTVASHSGAVSIGYETEAAGLSSIAMGRQSKVVAAAQYGVSIGYANNANSNYAVAMGGNNTANGIGSVALGQGVSTDGALGAIALGSYNTTGNNTRKLVVGHGTSGSPKDVFTILTDGKTGIDFNNFETTTSDAKLQVNGSVKIGTSSTCNASNEGVIRYDSTNKIFQGCNGTSWVNLN